MGGHEEAAAKRKERRPSGLQWSRGSGGPAVRVSPAAAFLILLSPPQINLKFHCLLPAVGGMHNRPLRVLNLLPLMSRESRPLSSGTIKAQHLPAAFAERSGERPGGETT